MKGRIFKFNPKNEPINGNMDNFLNNIVMNRDNTQIILTDKYGGISRSVAYNSIDENDIIFIQSYGYITHYMYCNIKGPNLKNNRKEISIKNINKIEKPIYSRYRNQTFNILDKDTVNTLLNQI
jgi:hypothetical protein